VKHFHALLSRVRGAGDALFALLVLAVVSLLVAPLSPGMLDALLALNLGLAATVLVVTLFARDALRFASFPTLLLLTTLFRLALNVSSTRLVLSRGDAGRVIQAFGRVVVQGNAVVGAVIFAILTLVQLLVVAKGAERVAEVAARFTLDALPGKQMSIDADLRAGSIDQAEARRRRRALERESQLYGAMDGALKFVKGDAIAGTAIVLVNVVGGLSAGALRGMPLATAARRYTLLAIGDGLASQIPALLLAVAAGVAVTRVASEEEGGTLGGEIGRQLSAEPRALWAVAALLAALAAAPALPALPFLALAAAAAAGARALSRRGAGGAARSAAEPDGPGAVAGLDPFAPPSPVVLELAEGLLDRAGAGETRFLREDLPSARERLWRELGVRLPGVALRGAFLPPGGWRLLLDEVPVAQGRAPENRAVALVSPEELALAGIPFAVELDPLSGERVASIAAEHAERAAALGPVRGPLECVAAAAAAALRRDAHRLVGVQEVQSFLDGLEPGSPALVREVGRQLPAPLVAEVLRRLLEEGVSIRPLRAILEAMLEAGGAARGAPALAEACRRALARHIAHRCAEAGPLEALLLDPAVEAAAREALEGEVLALDPDSARRILSHLEAELRAAPRPPVLLIGAELRRAVRNLVAPRFPCLPVVSFDELPPELPVRPIGRVGLAA
jgi:type III secretion protein V